MARFGGGAVDGRPAVTRNRFGRGTATYLATRPDPRSMAMILGEACRLAGVEPTASVRAGVEAVRREGSGGSFLFLLNHTDSEVEVALNGGPVRLAPRDVSVIRMGLSPPPRPSPARGEGETDYP